jgi:PAP2 superfamily
VGQAQGSAARISPLRALFRWHPPWYLELALVAVLLWGMDAVTGFRAGARVAGLANATEVRAISRDLGGHVTLIMNGWLADHAWLAAAAASYYIVLHGLITGVVGIALLRARPPRFALHRNALILATAIGTAVFWLYPVAPPRMLPGFHDIASDTVPFFASLLDSKAAGMFAALPSLHVIWAVWVAVAIWALVRRRL